MVALETILPRSAHRCHDAAKAQADGNRAHRRVFSVRQLPSLRFAWLGVCAMLKPALVAEVRRLLAEGRLSQRAIARRLGVSRGSVLAIARGKRPDRPPAEPLDEVRWEGPPARCPGCGGMVFLPCRACATRQAQIRKRLPHWPDTDEPLGLQLTDEHRRRYEEVRRWRQMRGASCPP